MKWLFKEVIRLCKQNMTRQTNQRQEKWEEDTNCSLVYHYQTTTQECEAYQLSTRQLHAEKPCWKQTRWQLHRMEMFLNF